TPPDGPEPLAGWIGDNLDPATVLVVDELTRAQLVRDGVDQGRLRPAGGERPPEALVVTTTRPTRGHPPAPPPGTSVPLATVDRGPGDARAEVRRPVTDLAATDTARTLDRDDRRRVGGLLAGNPSLTLSDAARAALESGAVDSRLITVLAGFSSAHRLGISEFVTVPAEPSDAPLRGVLITAVDGRPVTEPGAADLARQWLGAQLPPYRPLSVRRAGSALLVRYSLPGPLGLLGR
ncbi:MAG TPA: hypothetical protein VGD67_08025, partial [Pseudonocardiaceae bacterium]